MNESFEFFIFYFEFRYYMQCGILCMLVLSGALNLDEMNKRIVINKSDGKYIYSYHKSDRRLEIDIYVLVHIPRNDFVLIRFLWVESKLCIDDDDDDDDATEISTITPLQTRLILKINSHSLCKICMIIGIS